MKYDYIVGIDFGHGETSAAVWTFGAQPGNECQDVEFAMGGSDKRTMPSMYSLCGERVLLGREALSLPPRGSEEYHVSAGFKSDPAVASDQQMIQMCRFMWAVYHRITRLRPELQPGNHVVFIAAPSGWSASSVTRYGHLACLAGLPLPPKGGVLREALVAKRHFVQRVGGNGVRRAAEQGAVVLDMGSSTLDMTYFDASGHCLESGAPVGAGHVEEAMREDLLRTQAVLRHFEPGGDYAHLRDWMLVQIREQKEHLFDQLSDKPAAVVEQTPYRRTLNLDDFLEALEGEQLKIKYSGGELRSVLEAVGYLQSLRAAMSEFRTVTLSGRDVTAAFLTGGASRMWFMRGLVAEALGLKAEAVYLDNDPSLIVSRGIVEEVAASGLAAAEDVEKKQGELAAAQQRIAELEGKLRQSSASLEKERRAHAGEIEKLKKEHQSELAARLKEQEAALTARKESGKKTESSGTGPAYTDLQISMLAYSIWNRNILPDINSYAYSLKNDYKIEDYKDVLAELAKRILLSASRGIIDNAGKSQYRCITTGLSWPQDIVSSNNPDTPTATAYWEELRIKATYQGRTLPKNAYYDLIISELEPMGNEIRRWLRAHLLKVNSPEADE